MNDGLIHRAITRSLPDGIGYHYIRLCDGFKPSYPAGLTWDNDEVTCPKCLEDMESSNITQLKAEI